MDQKKEYVEILPREGNLYKANLHTHSTLSDGSFSPEQLKAMYMAEDYSVLAFTDHRKFVPHTDLCDKDFVALTSAELDFNLYDEKGLVTKVVHINSVSPEPYFEASYERMPYEIGLINGTVADLRQKGHFVTLNHPNWSNMSNEDVLAVKGVDAIEIFNSIGTVFNNYGDDSPIYEYALRCGERAIPVAGDDTHKIFEDGTPFMEYYQSFTMIKAKALSYESIFDALKNGRCYASTGPIFENIWLEGNKLCVECSPVFGVYVHSKYISRKAQDVRPTDCITHTAIDISAIREVSPYIWVQLRDTNGKKAWAMPYWFE